MVEQQPSKLMMRVRFPSPAPSFSNASPIQFDPQGDHRPVWAYVIVLGVLWSLPWLGVECLFEWCAVQGSDWWIYAAMLALPVLLFLEYPLRVFDRMTGRDTEDN